MRHLIYQAAYHLRKLKIKEWLFSLTDEREDPEEETAEVAQKKKEMEKIKGRLLRVKKRKKNKMTKILSY